MTTAFIIFLGLFFIFIINLIIVTLEKKNCKKKRIQFSHSRIKTKTEIVMLVGFVLIIIFVFVVNYEKEEISKDDSEHLTEYDFSIKETDNRHELTKEQQFLKDLGINEYADLEDSEFLMLEKAVELDLFAEKSLCEFYEEFKTLDYKEKYKEADKVIKSFKAVEGLDFLLMVKGYKLCPDALTRAKASRYDSKPSYKEADINPCIMAKDFIKQDLRYPQTANFSMVDCSSEKNTDGSYTVLRSVTAGNAFGVETKFIYKLRIGFTGGNEVDINNWKLIDIVSEEYRN